jgi:hypothetical protein
MTETFLSTEPYLDVEDVRKGIHIRFDRGVYSTDDDDEIAFLKDRPYFGASLFLDSNVSGDIRAAIAAATAPKKITTDSVTTDDTRAARESSRETARRRRAEVRAASAADAGDLAED